mmetsp:Transcript_9128/g.24061  ORF Transcript_9128/g.24061 Transcript_9128/m.24061 type:complete len:280 (-) Transcript_9128:218-1057(-)
MEMDLARPMTHSTIQPPIQLKNQAGVSPESKHTAGKVAGAVGKGIAHGSYEIVRQIPYLALVGILLAIVGSILTGNGLQRVGKSLGGAGIDLELVGRLLAIVLTITHAFALTAAIISLLSRGLLRELCCPGSRIGCLRAVECLVQDCFPRLVTVGCFLVAVVQLVLLIAYTVIFTVLVLVGLLCGVAKQVIDELLAAVEKMPFLASLDMTPPARDDAAIQHICAASDDNAIAAVMLVVGAVLLVLCMVLMLMSLSSSLAFNAVQRKQGRQEKNMSAVKV